MSSSRSASGTAKPGSLTNVVQSLVRAQYGLTARESTNSGASTPGGSGSKAGGETETDLDRHVAELLLKEAKEREERAKKENVGYWRLSDDEGEQQYQSKTNKRFLKTIIQNVEEHNKPLIRPEGRSRKEELDAIRARDRAERERRTGIKDSERSHRRAGQDLEDAEQGPSRSAAPGFAARSLALGLSGARDAKRDEDRKRKEIDDAIAKARDRATEERVTSRSDKGKERAYDQDSGEEVNRAKSASRSTRKTGSDRHRNDRGDDRRERSSRRREDDRLEEKSSRRRHRSNSRDRSDNRRSRSPRTDVANRRRDDREHTLERPSRSKSYKDEDRRKRRRSPECRSDDESEGSSSDTFIDTTEVGPSANGSKMDKYFTQAYNPALDVSFDDLTDPSTGLIGEGNFSEWDKMLHILKKRKEDRAFGVTQAREEERERQLRKLEKKKRKEEREALRALRKDKKRKKRRRGDSDSDDSASSGESVGPKMRSEAASGTVKVGDYEYGKRGTVRAWDLGKDAAF